MATGVRERLAEALNDPELTPEDRARLQATDPEQQIDAFLQEEHGRGGFLGYVQLAAKSGVTISRASSSQKENKPTVTGVGTYVLWGVEFLLAAGIAMSMAFAGAKQPFCERCDDWYGRVDILGAGSGGKENAAEVIRALETGDLERALSAEALGQPSDGATSILSLERCANCAEHEPLLTFKVVKKSGRNKAQESVKYKTLLRPDEAHTIDTLLAKRTAEEQAQAAVAQSA